MSTHVTIVKKPSGHNLSIKVTNPGTPTPMTYELADNQAVEVMVYGDGRIEMSEIEKVSAAANIGSTAVNLARLVQDARLDTPLDQEFELRGQRMRVLVETMPGAGG